MTAKPQSFDAIVIGAGAAGLFCAGVAGQRGLRVAVIDHAEVLGEKIRISGGGRCNFTNINASPAQFISNNAHFARSALSRYTAADFIALVKRHRIAFHEKKLGQLFCDDSAKQIIAMLLDEAQRGGVQLIHPAKVTTIEKTDRFVLHAGAAVYTAPQLVVATGGLSIPASGASPLGYQIAAQFGVPVTPLRAGLVPLALDAPDMAAYGELSGVSIDANVGASNAHAVFRENVLLTHRGLSGPAILQISNFWQAGDAVLIDLLPDRDGLDWLTEVRTRKSTVARALAGHVPERFAQAWSSVHLPEALAAKPLAQWTKAEMQTIATLLKAWPLKPSGTLGYKKAEVTLGGVDTHALSSKTMMATKVPGLYFIGEVVDVTGWLGGYNFQWAWSSAFAAAHAMSRHS
jgi:predicted Rossmann fold flavoprotein